MNLGIASRKVRKTGLRIHRLSGLAFTIFLVIPTGLFPLSVLDALGIATDQTAESAMIPKTDFNGDGYSDLAMGVYLEDVGTIVDAGAVNVIYGSSKGLNSAKLFQGNGSDDQIWTQGGDIEDDPEVGDSFGQSLATGDFNKDGYSDLAIGVPNEDVLTIVNAGAVNVIYGSSKGLIADTYSPGNGRDNQIWTQIRTGVEEEPESGDLFGHSLATGDFNKDGYSDLAIGVPGEDVTNAGAIANNSGSVNVIYGSSDGLIAIGLPPDNGLNDQIWNQSSPHIEEVPEPHDNFGATLATGDFNKDGYSDLAIGVEREDVGTIVDAGAVNVIYGSADGLSSTGLSPGRIWTQGGDIKDVPEREDFFAWTLATGDFNNDTISDLAIGVPLEDVDNNRIVDAGAVNVIYGSSDGLNANRSSGSGEVNQIWNQSSTGIDDEPEGGDFFGWVLATGDFNKDASSDLAIGVPLEDVGTIANAGAVNVIYGSSDGLSGTATVLPPNKIWRQGSADVDDDAEGGDFFGQSLATGDFNKDAISDLAIGVPLEDVGTIVDAGAVNVIYGSVVGIVDIKGGLSATVPPGGIGRADQIWTQEREIEGEPERGDNFGFSLP
jgi:uncharacterized protein YaaQ